MIVASTLWTEGFLDDLISFTRDLLWYLTGRQAIYSSLITANTLFYFIYLFWILVLCKKKWSTVKSHFRCLCVNIYQIAYTGNLNVVRIKKWHVSLVSLWLCFIVFFGCLNVPQNCDVVFFAVSAFLLARSLLKKTF